MTFLQRNILHKFRRIEALRILFKLEAPLFHNVLVDLLVIKHGRVSQTPTRHLDVVVRPVLPDRVREIQLSQFPRNTNFILLAV